MDPNVFRKGDSPSILVIEKPWTEVTDKPAFYEETEKRIIDMVLAADAEGLLTRPDTLRRLKTVVQRVLLDPLKEPSSTYIQKKWDGTTILADAYWDEISGIPEALHKALERIIKFKDAISQNTPLTDKSTLMETKTFVNETVLKPLKGINEDE